jgi:hypothetical protein
MKKKIDKILGRMFEIWTGSLVNEYNNRHVRQCQVAPLSSSFVYYIFIFLIIKYNTFHSQKWLFKVTFEVNRYKLSDTLNTSCFDI